MDRLVHLWIVVFVVTFVVITVESRDVIQPDNVFKKETRSASWRQVLLKGHDDDSDKITKRDYLKRTQRANVTYDVCLATSRGDGTENNVLLRAYGDDGDAWRYEPVGQGPGGYRVCCYVVSNFQLNEIQRVKVVLDGLDKWWPLSIKIYNRNLDRCYTCFAKMQCRFHTDECLVWKRHARTVDCDRTDGCDLEPTVDCHG